MADKKIVDDAYKKGATESATKVKVSALDVKTNQNGLELVAGEDAIKKLAELGVDIEGMTIPSSDNVCIVADNGEIVRKPKSELTLEERIAFEEQSKKIQRGKRETSKDDDELGK